MDRSRRVGVARTHRWLGVAAAVPLVAWVLSSFALHGVGLFLPEAGLRGEYELRAQPERMVDLEDPSILSPEAVLQRVAADGIARVYWLRLQGLAGRAVYLVKPGPFELERVYDARTAERLDPLARSMLRRVADGELEGTAAVRHEALVQFDRYYALDGVPAARFIMEGAQPSELVLSTASGRVLSRTDPLAALFDAAYRRVHVFQWGRSRAVFTAVLYGLVGLTLVVVGLGLALWIDRRRGRRPLAPAVRVERRLHARLAPWAALVLATQVLVGAYLWYNLGLVEPRFRGQGSFQQAWTGGIPTTTAVPPLDGISPADAGVATLGRAHAVEWRSVDGRLLALVRPRRDVDGVLFDARSGSRLGRLSPEQARVAADAVVEGRPVEYRGEATEYWMEYNAFIPTYLFRFDDPDRTDVHVSRITGEVIQRRPAIWRAFGPFLTYHTFAFTGNPWLDTVLLGVLQVTVLVMVVTGWRMARPIRRRRR